MHFYLSKDQAQSITDRNTASAAAGLNQSLGSNPLQVYQDQQQQQEVDLGYEPIPICRPRFIYFKFTGLRPSTRHFFFCDGVNVSNYVNTSSTVINNFNNGQKASTGQSTIWTDVGERYVNETGFPTDLGGPTSPLVSDVNGTLEGVFYLQRNTTLSFETGQLTLNVCDLSSNNYEEAISYASTTYIASGVIKYRYTDLYNTTVLVNNPAYVAPSNAGISGNSGNSNSWQAPQYFQGGTGRNDGGNNNTSTAKGSYSDPPGNVVSRTWDAITGQNTSTKGTGVSNADGRSGAGKSGDGCVIATHAVASGAFSKYEKARAVVWCEKALHDKWWGDIIRRGYRHLGRKQIAKGNAHKYYGDFKDYINFGTGKDRSIKNGLKFVIYTLRFFVAGIFTKEEGSK